MTEGESRPPGDLFTRSEAGVGSRRADGAASTGRALSRRERITLALLLGVGLPALRLLGWTLRLTEVNRDAVERLWADGGPLIYAAWHGRILMFPYFYGRLRTVHVLASRSRDGELVTRLARAFGFRVVRGSSSRGASTALRVLARLLRDHGAEVAIVPDGPRGPRCTVQPGAVLLAKLGRAPIVPLGFGVSRATVLGSWDAFVVPHPFARVAVVFGDPLVVPEDADRDALEACRQRLEDALRRLTAEADRLVGAPRVPPL
ncbi:MAG: lysophospholipid acyltransferase family protein [Candidatus Rokubacteria bacterium]|nr:lysophospholipid acyltransferase family protein [Candidatus Rokubacteria bacterium]